MNVRRGLVRLWIVITALIAIPVLLLGIPPLVELYRTQGTIGLEIETPTGRRLPEIRLNDAYNRLAPSDIEAVVDHLIVRFGITEDDISKCANARAAMAARKLAFPEDAPLKPWEVYSIRDAFPEYNDMSPEQLGTAVEKRVQVCRVISRAEKPLARPDLETIVQKAFLGSKGSAKSNLFLPTLGLGLIVLLWIFLFLGFWIASGFAEKPNLRQPPVNRSRKN